MMPFEYAVRPFQTPDSHGRIILPSTPGSSRERATLTWGAKVKGTLPTPQVIGFNTKCCKEAKQQTSNTMDPVSVTAEGDGPAAGQSIDFQRASVVKFDLTHQNSCAEDWAQFSDVGGAIDSAFADLKANIEAGGAGVSKNCKSESRFTHAV